jgi:hypothetical protein
MAKQKQSNAAKIRALLAEGEAVKDIAKKLKLKSDYVHQVRWHWKKDAKKVTKKADKPISKPEDPTALFDAKTYYTALAELGKEKDVVNHPAHYTAGGIEVIDFIEAKQLGYHLGNVIKYISRVDQKDDPIENLEKARWYLDREIQKRLDLGGANW